MKTRIFIFSVLFFASASLSGAEIFVSNLDNTTLVGATVSTSSCDVADAPNWAPGYSKGFLTGSSNGYATITFDPAIDLTGYTDVQMTVHWGSASSRRLDAAINGGSTTTIHAALTSAERSNVVDASCSISATTLTSIKFSSSGGGSVYFFDISITGTSSCSATAPGNISKGTLVGSTITLTAAGSPAANNTWYWQAAADGTATAESGTTKDVTAAGTYYIRSYYTTDDCWSDAKSITVTDEDFQTPCETPNITVQPSTASASYDKGDAATPLSVTASVSDGGSLSYQWYSSATGSTSDGVVISGATSSTYTPSTATPGTLYYYCVVTNTLAGHSSVSTTSNLSGAITIESSCPGTGGGVVMQMEVLQVCTCSIAGKSTYPVEAVNCQVTGGELELYNINSSTKALLSKDYGGTLGWNLNTGDIALHLFGDCELWEGDTIEVSISGSDEVYLTAENTAKPTTSSIKTSSGKYVVTATDELVGKTGFYVWRVSSSVGIIEITVTRPRTEATYTWTCPDNVTQNSSTTISVASDCSEPVTLAWTNSPIDGVSFNAATGELTVDASVPIGTAIQINASNAVGACAATSETKTIIVSLPAPTFVWTYDAIVNAGARYPISVASPDGVTITLTLADDPVPAGVATNITGNSGTYDVQGSFMGTELTFKASSPATASFRAHEETRTVSVTTCFMDNIIYVDATRYMNAGSSAKPRYFFDQPSIGRLSKDFGGSSMSAGSGYTIDGHTFPNSISLSYALINSYIDNVVKLRLYVVPGGNNRTITGIYYSPAYFNSKDKGTNITTACTIQYESGSNLGASGVGTYVDIYPSVLLNSTEYLYITFSGNVSVCGVSLVAASGSEPSALAWNTPVPANPKRVTVGDAPFTHTAVATGTVKSLGVLTYASSDPQVATVDSLTGEVTILDKGSSYISANLSASGCYAEAEISYRLEVQECQDDPCVITAPKTTKCPSESVTLTVVDCEEFADIQWYKNGIALSGETGTTLTTDAEGEYKAVATKNCHQHSNVITITNLTASPTVEAIYTYYYIKNNLDDFHSLNLALFNVANADDVSASFNVEDINCTLVIEDGKIYLRGKPAISANNTITFQVTVQNTCNGASANSSMELRLLAPTAQPTVAWVVTGSDEGGFDAVTSGEGAGNQLFDYLNSHGYSLTAVNDYATTNETLIAQYYSQFDLVVMTDFPNSKHTHSGKSYTNAVGSLIDKKPMLSMEAFVSAQPNWRISSDPYNPSTRQKRMKLLCAAHQIFDPAVEIGVYDEGGNEFVNVLTNTTNTKTLQGFSPVSIPDFIFIATIDGGSHGELVSCCERQTVLQARFMILGIEATGMNAMESGAQQMVKQILDYLLIADPTLIADCSLVFDNGNDGAVSGSGDNLWSNPHNWGPNHGSLIPSPYHAVRIERPCKVDIADAHASSARLAQGAYLAKTFNGSFEVLSEGALSLTGFIKRTYNGDFLTRYPLEEGDVTVHADASHNGAFIWGDPDSEVPAEVDLYSKANGAGTSSPVWQYIGSPFASRMTAIEQFHYAWMCRWSYMSNPSLGGTWTWVLNEDRIDPFVGYTITQESAKTYTWSGILNTPETKVIPLKYTADADGFAMVANSWVAPINIAAMEAGDFDGADPTIYIFNTGTYAQYVAEGTPPGDATVVSKTGAGQYSAVPVNSAPYVGISTIAPMQGFFVQTTRNGNLTLDYKKIVLDSVNFASSTTPMRAPKHINEEEEPATEPTKIVPEVMQLNVVSENWGDKVFLLSHSEFSDAYELGWEGRKQEGVAKAPYLAVEVPSGKMAVAAVPSFEERYLSFRAGEDTAYTFSFAYNGEPIYLYDQVTEQATQIKTGNTYSFSASNKTPAQRFLITKNPPLLPMDISLVETEGILHFENYAKEPIEVRIVDMQGRVVWTIKSSDEIVDIAPSLPYGVYLAHVKMGSASKVIRIIGKEGAR